MIGNEPLIAPLQAVRAIHPAALPYLSFYRFTGRSAPIERYFCAVLGGSLPAAQSTDHPPI